MKKRFDYLVVGLGKTGVAIATVFDSLNVEYKITDTRPLSEIKDRLESKPTLKKRFVEYNKLGDDFENVVVSPGVSFNDKLIQNAIKNNLNVISEIELAYQMFPRKIIAVTGTNGKTTTTTIIGEILKSNFKNVIIAGNIGYPLIEACAKTTKDTIVVAEVSSYQLEGIKNFKPFISICLNIGEDHLDWHGSFENYIRAKGKIFKNQRENDFAILNFDDKNVRLISENCKAKKVYFSTKSSSCQVFFKDKAIYFLEEGEKTKVVEEEEILLKGRHNMENIMSSISACYIMGISLKTIKKELIKFKPIDYRIEVVGEVGGRIFVNDSKSTNVSSTKSAIETFKEEKVLIIGGKDKGLNLLPLVESINKNKVKSVIVIGNDAKSIANLLIENEFRSIYCVDSMKDAVIKAYFIAEPKEIILFSPGFPSFDKYKDYVERGRDFTEKVKSLTTIFNP